MRSEMSWQANDAHDPPDQVLEFLSVPLRLSSLVEMLVSQRDNTLLQLAKCAHWYRERALRELYPRRKNLGSLNTDMRRVVSQRAIELAIEDSRSSRSVPEENIEVEDGLRT
jgi:hypothetical protein